MYETNYGSNNGQGQQFAMGLLCGAAVGAAIGLLLAPKSGAELRNTLAGSASRLRKSVDDGYNHAVGMVDRAVEDGREAVKRGREAFDRTRADFADEMSERNNL